jgi:hypothetical protein
LRNYVEYFWRLLTYSYSGGGGDFVVVNGTKDDWEESVFAMLDRFNLSGQPGLTFSLSDPVRQYVLLDKDQVLAICQLNGGFIGPGGTDPRLLYKWIALESPRKTWSHGE